MLQYLLFGRSLLINMINTGLGIYVKIKKKILIWMTDSLF